MLRIPTFLADSRIHGAGLGLFCMDFVPAGTLVWRLDPGFEVILHELPADPVLRRFVEVYGYMPLDGPPRWVICIDDGRFINHAEVPNTRDDADTTVAVEDLPPGTEITSDYRSFCRMPFVGWSGQLIPA